MMSAAQLQQLRGTMHRTIADTFPTTITIGEHDDIPAARWSAAKAAANQPLGLILPTVDLTIRVARADLTSRSITIVENKTRFSEGGVTYVVEKVREAKGDPGLLLEGRRA